MHERLSVHTEPLCGLVWLRQHQYDYTQRDIDSLRIVVSCNGKELPPVSQDRKDRGIVKDLVKSYRKEKG